MAFENLWKILFEQKGTCLYVKYPLCLHFVMIMGYPPNEPFFPLERAGYGGEIKAFLEAWQKEALLV